MTRKELEMRKLVRESDVIDKTDGSELAKAFNYLWEKYIEQEPCENANVSTTDERITRYKKIEDTVKEIVKDEKCVYTNEMVYGFMKIKRILEGEEDNE